jgi:type VI secretion system protein ImpH
MAGQVGEEADPVTDPQKSETLSMKEALARISGGYAFSRAVEHLLRVGGTERRPEDWLRFKVNPNLSFPPDDIHGAQRSDDDGNDGRVWFVLNLMGLHGAASPLPAYFSEYVAQHQDEPDALRDFLDVINHHLISLFYGIWNKYRYYLQFRDNGTDINSRRFFSFIGLGHKELQGTSGLRRERLLSYMGLIAFSGEATGSLESILRHYFGHPLVHIIPCIRRQVPIPADQQCSLGMANCRLSSDLLLGSEVLDQTGKFRVLFDALSWKRFTGFLPGGSLFSELQTLVRFVLRSRLGFDVELRLRPQEIPEFVIGQASPCRLGWTTWAGVGGDGVIVLETDSRYVD